MPIGDVFAAAAEGQVYVCGACGKRSKDRAGKQKLDAGWDESCMLNAVFCYEEKGPEGRWRAVKSPPTGAGKVDRR